jgi:hypothetical protein
MECLALPWSQVLPPGQFEAVLAIAYSIEAMQQTDLSAKQVLLLPCIDSPMRRSSRRARQGLRERN